MKALRAFVIRLTGFLSRRRWERDLDEELEANLQLHIDDNLRAGMSPEEARRAAIIQFGHLEPARESYRDRRSLPLLDHLAQDLRHAARTIRRAPVFTAVIVLSLGLGIGANTAIFNVIDAVLLRDLPVREPGRLFTLAQTGARGPKEISNISYGLFRQLAADRRALAGIFTFHGLPRANVIINGEGEVTDVLQASHSYFDVLGVQPILGRGFEPGEDNVAVISHRYWQRRFDAQRDALGHSITINGRPYSIIGVTPPEFFGVVVGTWTDVTVPAFTPAPPSDDTNVMWVMGRLADGVTEQQTRDALTVHARARIADPGARPLPTIAIEPAARGFSFLRERFSKPLHVLMATAALVLLIACANVAGMLLARASARRHEIAVRAGLGAGRGRLVRQLLTESVVLALMAAAVGTALAASLRNFAPAFMSSMNNPVGLYLALDRRVLLFTLLLSVVTAVVFGLVPALQSTRVDLASSLKDAARTSSSARARLRRALVVVQMALALLLVSGAALFARTLANLKGLDTGFRADSVLLLSLEPAGIGYAGRRVARLYEEILDRVEQVPGVRSATLLRHNLLGNGHGNVTIVVPGRLPQPEDRLELAANFAFPSGARRFSVGPRFVEALGITLLEGRDLTRADREGSARVAIVNESFARHFFPGESAVGKRYGHSPDLPSSVEIVGVIKDVRHVRLREQPVRSVYEACLQDPGCWRDTTLQVRTAVGPASLTQSIRAAIAQVAPGLPVYNVTTVRRMFDAAVATERTLATAAGFFGAVALLLACVGLYGLLSWSVEQRRREIGIRIALGADTAGVLGIIFRETGLLVLAGIVLGLPATYAAGRWIATFLYDLKPTDTLTLLVTVAALLAVAAASALLPARRAARVDPMTSLRHE